MTITLTVTAIDLETVLACLRFRAHVIGDATAGDRAEQERLYRLAADLDMQASAPKPKDDSADLAT